MAKPDKVAAVAEIAESFRSSSATVVTQYTGLSVSQLSQLRRALGTTDEALQQAVKAVGTRVDKVKDYLGAGAAAGDQSGA